MSEDNQGQGTGQEKVQEPKKANKPMFWVGITMMAIAAILFLTVEKDLGLSPMILGFLGLISIGASRYRPMK